MAQEVHLIVTNRTTGDFYFGRSYPDDDYNNDGKIERYRIPVYIVKLEGIRSGKAVSIGWKALRFMPYWNDPKNPGTHYKTKG